ncbi:non-functional NADPH-dependent codeinone reductase 2-like [Magnolia sinica]|uniref:non-functional NADPH-dependent codeinone reductase 2-like n=1 Tax=Magnolia sinica TaxID=86752 RepID=UPI002658867F|nr:non-functional NADPH-dependent codeinone reductase 2-like [Magnolia sinica]
MAIEIPKVSLSSGTGAMPVVGMGSAIYPPVAPEITKAAVLHSIEIGYRHFDTASAYGSEPPLGEAIAEALQLGLVKSRDELFITSKLWYTDNQPDLVLPAIKKSLEKLQLEYLDLYLIHWPVSVKPGENKSSDGKENLCFLDYKSVWEAMEECQKLGLTKSIGVSNFSCKKLAELLSTAKIPPSVNQVEMHPAWQQQKLREFCKMNGIHVTAYSPLGAKGTLWGSNDVMDSPVLKEIAEARGKTVAQISLRWIYEQEASMAVKSFNKERMKENAQIFDWELTESEVHLISQIPQRKAVIGDQYITPTSPFKSLEELWDGEI